MDGKVFANPPRRLSHLIEPASKLSTATLAAALGEPRGRDRLIDQGALTRVSGTGVIAGQVVTAWSPAGNNTMIRFGMEACESGDVLVIASPSVGSAQWGDLATAWSVAAGIAAVVVYGSVRDISEVRASGQSVWARTIDPRQAAKDQLGYVNAPVRVGGVTIAPGDLLVADDDAVIVLGPDLAERAVTLGQERAAREEELLAHVRGGGGVSELMPTVPTPEFIDQTWEEWSSHEN